MPRKCQRPDMKPVRGLQRPYAEPQPLSAYQEHENTARCPSTYTFSQALSSVLSDKISSDSICCRPGSLVSSWTSLSGLLAGPFRACHRPALLFFRLADGIPHSP